MHTTTDIETIWHEFARPLRGFIRHRIASEQDADDILQQVFLKIQTRLATVRDTEKLQGWLYRITRNAIIDHYRHQRPHEPLPENLTAAAPADDQRCAAELAQCLGGLVDRLDSPYRDAVRLSELDGLPQRAVAAQLGLSLSGAKSRVQRGRAQLKNLLLDCCHIETDRYGNILDSECKRACGCEQQD